MKTFRPGLRIQILFSLTLLLVAAMMLTGFVVMKVTERDLMQYKAQEGMAVVEAIQAVLHDLARGQGTPPVARIRERLKQDAPWMGTGTAGVMGNIVIVGKDGAPWLGDKGAGKINGGDAAPLTATMKTEERTTRIDRHLGLLVIRAPLFVGDHCVAAVQVPVPIDPVLEGLRRSRQVLWLYIGLNALVLLLFGNFLLSRIVIRPIKHLVDTVEHFEEAEPFPMAGDQVRNEISRLTLSLNRMVKRLAENKERMETQIRSLKEAREEVLRSERLSSIGRLAAGVAHEVGNPLGAILGYTDLLARHTENDEEAKDYLLRIEKEITRIDTIVRELLDFSRPSVAVSAPVEINALVSESVSFLSHQKLMASVRLETRLEKDLKTVWADPDQLKQVLINLMFNASDAMETGGELTISTGSVPSVEGDDPEAEKGRGDLIEIAVSDTGKGIRAQDLDKIFHPFYTTKPPGKGTGLGLAISLRIVESFRGTISVESVEEKGTTIRVRLPVERRA
ncbi:MAG: ATP-binding protein [Thermodesulfobacteriota bacterium]|nr:ATP-binding protein [Thermodesulfobacteriota bacterium]